MSREASFTYPVTIEPENEVSCGNCTFAASNDGDSYVCLIFGGELQQGLYSPKRHEACKQAGSKK